MSGPSGAEQGGLAATESGRASGPVPAGVAPQLPVPAPGDRTAMVKTYRYLRGGLAGVVVLLAVAIVKSAIENDCLQTSISAYYHTPVRPVFVGMLMIFGFGLIILRGESTTEDVLLNIAGMLAPIVAVMPTTSVGTCAINEPNLDPVVDGELAGWVIANVDNNLWALMITGLIGVVATGAIGWLAVSIGIRQGGSGETLSRRTGFGLAITGAIIIGAMVLYGSAPDWSREHAHGWSALAMFALLAAVALLNSRSKRRTRTYRRIYLAIAALMTVFAVFCWLALGGVDHQTLILEAGEILLFAAYWIVQTVENWDSTTPRQPGRGPVSLTMERSSHALLEVRAGRRARRGSLR